MNFRLVELSTRPRCHPHEIYDRAVLVLVALRGHIRNALLVEAESLEGFSRSVCIRIKCPAKIARHLVTQHLIGCFIERTRLLAHMA